MNSYPIQPCYLIQDNDPKHGSELCADALAKHDIPWVKKKILILYMTLFYSLYFFKNKIAPYSPDINIIELVWADCKRYLRKKLCETKEELIYRIHKYFKYKLTVKKCQSFINHLIKVNDFFIHTYKLNLIAFSIN